jgi:hypothetical protein
MRGVGRLSCLVVALAGLCGLALAVSPASAAVTAALTFTPDAISTHQTSTLRVVLQNTEGGRRSP